MLRVDGEIFESRKKKLQIQQKLDTCGWGLRHQVGRVPSWFWSCDMLGDKKLPQLQVNSEKRFAHVVIGFETNSPIGTWVCCKYANLIMC